MTVQAVILPLAVDGILGQLDGIRRSVVDSKLAAFSSLAAVVGGVLAAFVLLKLAHDYIDGRGLTLGSVLRPFIILMCVCNFNVFVANPIHSLCNIFTNGMMRQTGVTSKQYLKQMGEYMKEDFKAVDKDVREWMSQMSNEGGDTSKDKKEATEESGVKGFFTRMWGGIVNSVTMTYGVVSRTVEGFTLMSCTAVLNAILLFIMRLVLLGQQVYCYVYLTLLSLLGPFAFALAILPSFSGSISSWIARYIQISFWIPVGQLIMYINYRMLGLMAGFAAGYDMGAGWTNLAVMVVCILNILSVPKVCAYVIESSGANGAAGPTLRAPAAAAGAAARGARVASRLAKM